MLEELNITNLGIVDDTSLTFTKGLNVLTGETGAGKSMILNGLGLLLGARAKTSLISEGKDQLTVEGCWSLDTVPSFLEERNATVEEGQLFVSRSVKNDGKSRAVVGGRSLPASTLSEISSQLVSIHGQADQLKLKSNSTQLKIVDDYGGKTIAEILSRYKETYDRWIKLNKTIREYRENSALKQKEREFYNEVVDSFAKVDPLPGEDEELRQKIKKLENIDAISEYVNRSAIVISNEEELPDLLELSYTLLQSLSSAAEMDETLTEMSERASNVNTEIADLSRDISSYLSRIDYEAIESLNEAQERLSRIARLNRKYDQLSLEEFLEFHQKALEWLEDNPSADNIDELNTELETLSLSLRGVADELTEERVRVSTQLAEKMNEALSELNMGSSVFLVESYHTDFSSTGVDIIEFMLKAHKSAEPNPINKTASGGELSRIMLALETVTANTEELSTFVFDEIDSGVGGETAVQIGKRLAELAKHSQVIVVTHLPQVASFADNHLLIEKQSNEDSVNTTVRQLNESDRRSEIARMLSGLNDSDTGLAHADELLKFANGWKSAS